MKTIKLVIIGAFVAWIIYACNSKSKTAQARNLISTFNTNRTCYVPFELNPLNNMDTINRMFYDGTKLGHWITFKWIFPEGEYCGRTSQKPVCVKVEEGNYVNNKREGFWKFYRKDGTFRDSVIYKDGEGGC